MRNRRTTIQLMACIRRGSSHETNEDAFGINGWSLWSNDSAEFPPWKAVPMSRPKLRAPLALAVADGVGGRSGAGAASRLVASQASQHARVADIRSVDLEFQDIHDELLKLGMDRTGSTVAAVAILGSGDIVVANIGDTRVYYNGDRDLLVEASTLDQRFYPGTKVPVLSRYLGMTTGEIVRPHVAPLDAVPFRRIVVATDGMLKAIPEAHLQELVLRRDGEGGFFEIQEVMAEISQVLDSVEVIDDATLVLADVCCQERSGAPRDANPPQHRNVRSPSVYPSSPGYWDEKREGTPRQRQAPSSSDRDISGTRGNDSPRRRWSFRKPK